MNKTRKVLICVLVIIVIILLILCTIYNIKQKAATASSSLEAERLAEEPSNNEIDIENLENIDNGEEIEANNIEENKVEAKNTVENKKNVTKTSNQIPYYIKVNYGAQVVIIYKKDDNGNYTVPVKAMVCSTGSATPTSGVYKIPARWEWLRLQGYVWGHYSTQIKGNILFHSVPYLEKGNPASLEYWEYDKLGTAASAGCVRLTVKDAKWIYDNCAKGTQVEFYSSSDVGPLGKPSAKKISSYPDNLRNWDPTDPNEKNPWRNYKESTTQNTTKNETVNITENKVTNTNKNETTNTQTNTVKNEVTNTVTNTTQNTVKNEITNKAENKITNTCKNETTNTQANTVKNETINTAQNTIKNETVNINNVTKTIKN